MKQSLKNSEFKLIKHIKIMLMKNIIEKWRQNFSSFIAFIKKPENLCGQNLLYSLKGRELE